MDRIAKEGVYFDLCYSQCPVCGPALDMPVELLFRRIHLSGGRPNYYWKATPVPEA